MTDKNGKPGAGPAPSDGRRWDDLRLVAVRIADEARKAGAAHAEVLLRRRCRRAVEDRGPVVGPLWDDRITLRCADARGRRGHATGTWAEVDATVAKAIAAIGGAPDPHERPVGRMDIRDRGLGIDDPRLPRVTDADRQATIDDNLAGVASISRALKVKRLTYYEEREERAFASTAEVSAAEASTRFSIQGAVAGAGGPEVDGLIASRVFAEVSSRPLGVDLARRCLALAKAAPLPEGPTHTVLGQRAVARLLEGLVPAFAADRVAGGTSFLAGKLGRVVGSARLHVIDDATRMSGLGTRAFDERGVPSVPVPLIKEGVAGGVYQGPLDAAVHDTRPTGHARIDGALWPGNLVVRCGNRTRNMLFPDLGRFVLVEDIFDVSGIDPVTGRIVVPARVLVHDGTDVLGSPGVVTLETTADEIFQNLENVASDQERHGLVDTGSWVVSAPLRFVPA